MQPQECFWSKHVEKHSEETRDTEKGPGYRGSASLGATTLWEFQRTNGSFQTANCSSAYQVPELRSQTSVGGLFHVHHFCVCAQDVELPKSMQHKTQSLKMLRTRRQTREQSTRKASHLPFDCVFLIHVSAKKHQTYVELKYVLIDVDGYTDV